MASRPDHGPWGTNILVGTGSARPEPPERDSLIGMYDLADNLSKKSGLWHAGGISLMGDVLAIPIENSNKSEIHFYDVSDPTSPQHFRKFISRQGTKAGAVAVCRIPSGHYRNRYLCGVREKENVEGIDFYLSKNDIFGEGFAQTFRRWSTDVRSYQAINFLQNGSGELFLVGTGHHRGHRAGLFSVELDSEMNPTLNLLDSLKLKEPGYNPDYYDLAAAGGIHVDHKGRLLLYSAPCWRMQNEFRFAECSEGPDPGSFISSFEDSRIELFKKADYKGRALSIYGKRDAEIPDYDNIWVSGRKFGREVLSVRFQLPKCSTYRLFSKEGFPEDDEDSFDLDGTGKVREIPKLSDKWKRCKVRSSKFVNDA